MSEVVASLLVKFGSDAGSDALVILELDGDMNGEKTSFAPGDEIFFRLHHDSSVQLDKIAATHGQITGQGTGPRSIEQYLLFGESDDTHDLSNIPLGSLSELWLGNQATGLRKSGSRTVSITGGVLPALGRITYSASFSLFRLLAPDVDLATDESYQLVIVAYMGAA